MENYTSQELLIELQSRLMNQENTIESYKGLMYELSMINKKLEQSEAAKSNFIATIKNGIYNPFSAIIGISENISSICKDHDHADHKKIKSMASLIHIEALKLDFQLKNIFAAAEIEAGEAIPAPAKVNIHDLLNEVFQYFNLKIHERRQQFKFVNNLNPTEDESLFFITDPAKLQIIISNIVNNAIEFSKKHKKIWFTADFSNKQLKITVKDEGDGIPPDKVDEVFNRFNNLNPGMTPSHHGHGLGLSVTKALLEIINGTISFKSEKWKGSEFIIIINELSQKDHLEDFFFGGSEMFSDTEEKY
jgi:signal transduction histidine kinase